MNYKKLIVLDLDDTLWEGNIGDGDVKPLAAFQRALKDLKERGVLLALASKNTERVALSGIKNTPGMVLQDSDFVAHRINWGDKAQNIADMATELNLGLQSIVFIDNSPVERGRVREALPEVLVPEWPEDPAQYVVVLESLDSYFDASEPTEEDLMRTEMYARERARAKSKSHSESLEDWLKTLGTRITVSKLDDESLPRTVQLLNKTNQMNLATRRMSEDEFKQWASADNVEVYTFRVADRFGDAGLTGILGLCFDDVELTIADFVLSCRVMGRLVEEAIVAQAVKVAKEKGLCRIKAEYVPTAKNAPCLDFWSNRSGFNREGNLFYSPVCP